MTLFPQFEPVMASAPPTPPEPPLTSRSAMIASAIAVVVGIAVTVVLMLAGTDVNNAAAAVDEANQRVAVAEAALEGHKAEATRLAIEIAGFNTEISEKKTELSQLQRLALGYDEPPEGSELTPADYELLIVENNDAQLQAETERTSVETSLNETKALQEVAENELATIQETLSAQRAESDEINGKLQLMKIVGLSISFALVVTAAALWIRYVRRRPAA